MTRIVDARIVIVDARIVIVDATIKLFDLKVFEHAALKGNSFHLK